MKLCEDDYMLQLSEIEQHYSYVVASELGPSLGFLYGPVAVQDDNEFCDLMYWIYLGFSSRRVER